MSGKSWAKLDAGVNPDAAQRAQTDLQLVRSGDWFRKEAWSISPHNFEGAEGITPPTKASLVDITGRVIEQMAGIALSASEKASLAAALHRAGIRKLQVALHTGGVAGQEHTRAVASLGLPIEIEALVYSTRDVEIAADVGATIVEVVTVGRPSLHATYRQFSGSTDEDLVESALVRVEAAKKLGMGVRADINLAGFASADYVQKYAKAMHAARVDELGIADGSSALGPSGCARLVKLVKEAAPDIAITMHLHNDFGLALANAMAALEAGATTFDVSVDGLGERAGQLDLAQWAVVLEAFYGISTGVDFQRLNGLSRLVEDLSRTRVPDTHPITGRFAFDTAVESVLRHEAGIDEMLHAPMTPGWVGASRHYPLGRHTGEFGLLQRAERLGLAVPTNAVAAILRDLDQWFETRKRPIQDPELLELLMDRGCMHKEEASA